MVEVITSPKQEVQYDIPDMLRGTFRAMCQDIVESMVSAMETYEQDSTRFYNGGSIGGRSYQLASFDRTKRQDRKLEKNLRKFIGTIDTDENVTVAPYLEVIPPDSLYMELALIDVPAGNYSVDLIRTVTNHETAEDGSFLPNVVSYMLLINPTEKYVGETLGELTQLELRGALSGQTG